MVDKNDALIREVEEELRREQMAKLWDRYGTYVLGGAVALVALVGGYKVWETRKLAAAEASGATYTEALKLTAVGKQDEASKALDDLVASGHTGYAALAELQKAGALLRASRPLDALTVFDKVVKDTSVDATLRDFAAVQAAALRVADADFTEMQNRLTLLSGDGSPWRHQARELLGLAALKANRPDDVRAVLGAQLADGETPQRVQERARVMLGSLAATELSKAGGLAPAAPVAGSDSATSGKAAADKSSPPTPADKTSESPADPKGEKPTSAQSK
ncbi:MAG: tetratricopeptide repeat protein [Hyphomicrobium sp.]